MTASDIKLLIVDDETVFRGNLAKLLQKRGFSCQQAADGKSCLDVFEKDRPDVVILDVKLPDFSGIQVLEQLRKKSDVTEVILLTGEATTQGGVEGIKAGAFDYLAKPIEIEHLITKISQAHDKILRLKAQKREADFRQKVETRLMTTERLAALGTLAAGVAHEINNPLAIINEAAGWITMLLKKEELSGFPYRRDFENALEKIEKSIERAKRITHQLLGMVKNHDEVHTRFDLAELATEAIQLVSRVAQIKRITFEFAAEPERIQVISDPYQLRQVIINLLSNAIEAEPVSGTIRVSLVQKRNEVTIAVQDHGSGIPGELAGKVFDPFFTTKAPGQGTGLGLFVSRRITERLCGDIEFKSQLGRGTTFYVTLPKKALEFKKSGGNE